MKKIFGVENSLRHVLIFIGLIPLFVIIAIQINLEVKTFYSLGYLVYFSIYGLFLFFYIRINFFDWNVYVKGRSLILTRLCIASISISNFERLKIRKIIILSSLLKVYKLEVNSQKYIFKANIPFGFIRKLFHQESIVLELEGMLSQARNSKKFN